MDEELLAGGNTHAAVLRLGDTVRRPPALNPAPIEGTVWNQDRSQVVGGILLFAPEGWLSSLEIYSVSDDTMPVFPPLDLIDFELSK